MKNEMMKEYTRFRGSNREVCSIFLAFCFVFKFFYYCWLQHFWKWDHIVYTFYIICDAFLCWYFRGSTLLLITTLGARDVPCGRKLQMWLLMKDRSGLICQVYLITMLKMFNCSEVSVSSFVISCIIYIYIYCEHTHGAKQCCKYC